MVWSSRNTRAPTPQPPRSDGAFLTAVFAAATGAALMYLFDPDNGRRRRAMLRDKSSHYARSMRDAEEILARRSLHHVQGALASIRNRIQPPEPVSDDVLLERVRAALGHVIDDPHALDVKVRDGIVILKGPVVPDDVNEIVACTERVRGVRQVDNRLSPNTGHYASPS
jgi:osmotically-inducible protein OsmY